MIEPQNRIEPTIQIIEDDAEFYETAKTDVVLAIKETLKQYPDCHVGVAGGVTPQPLFELLTKESLAWEKIKWVIIDERYVPSDHPESNLGMMRRALLNHVPIPQENIIAFDTSLPQESAAKDMIRKVVALSSTRFPIFDLLILGVGEDGHIGSLFEGDSAMEVPPDKLYEYALPAHARGYPTEMRLTLTLMALRSGSRALILLKGKSKSAVLEALEGKKSEPKLTALRVLMSKMPVKVLYEPC